MQNNQNPEVRFEISFRETFAEKSQGASRALQLLQKLKYFQSKTNVIFF